MEKTQFSTLKLLTFAGIIYFCFLAHTSTFAQENVKLLNLEEVVYLSQNQSSEAFLAKHRFRASYWQFRTHKAQYLPSLTLSATLPDLNRSISKITLSDGSDVFRERKVANSSIDLAINQNIGLTGGKIFITSDLQRIDLLGDNGVTSYLSTPISIGFMQPLFSFNALKWEKKIEPMLYEEAKKQYIVAMENVASRAIGYFFDLALAQLNVEINEANFSNNDTLYKIALGRYNIGTIAQNEVLQMELGYLQSKAAKKQAQIDLELCKFKLRSFLGFNDKVNIKLVINSYVPDLQIDVNKAIEMAKSNNPDMLGYKRQLIEAERDVAQASAAKGFSANLYASYGLTQSAATIPKAYENPIDQQHVKVGIDVPIVDWGLGRGKYKMALSDREAVNITVNQLRNDFEQDVFLKVMQFNLQADQFRIVAKSDTVAQMRYNITKQRFMIGKIDVLNLNIALNEKDAAKREFIASLRNYWQFYYTIRKITLFDFTRQTPINQNFDKLLE